MSDRVILHCDCNSFFASVETVLNPAYRDVPMAVCGSREDRHGIVLAKNEHAKKYGIKTAETVYSALKKCPNLVIAEPHHSAYAEFSRRANEIYARYTDMIEPFGIDESWLDVTASRKLFGSGEEIAKKISEDIKKELSITVSIGVSFNKVFAKLGSDYKKPDAITVIGREDVERIVYPLPAADLLFVGKRTAEELSRVGIKTIGDLARADAEFLKYKFGKMGDMLYRYSRGLDDSPVSAEREESKSISSGFTFKHDLVGYSDMKIAIEYLSEDIGTKLRKKGLKCRTVQLTVKDEYLNVIQRQRPQDPPSDISREIAECAYRLLVSEWSAERPVRMLTVCATSLVSASECHDQISIFDTGRDEKRSKRKEAENTVDKLRQKFGNSIITKGAIIDTDFGIYTAPSKDKRKN